MVNPKLCNPLEGISQTSLNFAFRLKLPSQTVQGPAPQDGAGTFHSSNYPGFVAVIWVKHDPFSLTAKVGH